MQDIIPKSKTKGTDFCGVKDDYYIIRPDLGCYMRSSNFNKGLDLTVFSLHPSCQSGEHYLGHEDGSFYIIKGRSYRRMSDLSTDAGAVVSSLHPNCCGGDHYLCAHASFFTIYQEKGVCRRTADLSRDSESVEFDLHPSVRSGLYYWGLPKHCYFLKPGSEWGVEYCKTTDLSTDQSLEVYSLHPDVLNFCPGGLSVTQGPAFGVWENIKTITNDSDTPVTWQKKISRKVGYSKEKMSQISHNWRMATSASAGSAGLSALIAKSQFSVSAEYGGAQVRTDSEVWSDAADVEEQITFELKPGQRLFVWQYRLGFGRETVLFCRDIKIDDEPDAPTEVPLPPAHS